MHIAIIGTGYVGLVSGTCFAEFGNRVTCVDSDGAKIEKLKKGIVPFYEPGLEELIHRNLENGFLSFTTDVEYAVTNSLVVFIAVGTPSTRDGGCDLSYIDQAAESIGKNLNGYKVIVTKSTVPVGTGERIRKIITENLDPSSPHQFDIVSNPEFLREGSAIEDFMHPQRVVIGTSSGQAAAILKDLYSPLYLRKTPFVITDVRTAELIKYATNAYLATKISFINEIANLCDRLGSDVHVVAEALGLDGRIGPKFLHPGPGYGGSCLPKDTRALVKIAESVDYDLEIVKTVIEVNERQKRVALEKIKEVVEDPKGKVVGVLGLSYKPNTSDVRESPALDIIRMLVAEGATVKAYDPAAMGEAKEALEKSVEYCKDSYEAARDSDALVIVTEWNKFRSLDLGRIKGLMRSPVLVDLRNIYSPEKANSLGFRYICTGRSGKFGN